MQLLTAGRYIATTIQPTLVPDTHNPGGFNWNINGNFTQNETEVKELTSDSEIIVYSGFTNLGNAAIVGQPLGVIVGNAIQRDENGNYVVNSIGNYIEDPNLSVLGDPNPDWVLNVGNSVKYKNFNFNFLISYVHGGDIYSETIATLLGRGLTTDTEDRLNTFILPGVNESGDVNNFQVNASGYYFDNLFSGPDEMRIFDASVIRLQEISLGYEIPKKWLEKTFFGGLSFISIFFIQDKNFLLGSMVGIGVAWAAILAMPYTLLSECLPAKSMGVYMGLFNASITLPQIAAGLFGGIILGAFGGSPIMMLVLAGVSMIIAGILVFTVKEKKSV